MRTSVQRRGKQGGGSRQVRMAERGNLDVCEGEGAFYTREFEVEAKKQKLTIKKMVRRMMG